MGQCWNLLPVPAMVQEFGDFCRNGADDSGRSWVCCKSGRNAVSYSSLDVGFV